MKSQTGYREAKEFMPLRMRQVSIDIQLHDDHFIVDGTFGSSQKLVCHTLTEVMTKLRRELNKAFPVKKDPPKPAPKKKAKERSGLPKPTGVEGAISTG